MNFIKHLFSYDFLIYIDRLRLHKIDKAFGIAAAVVVLVAIAVRIAMAYQRGTVRVHLLRRIWQLCITMGLLGVLWFGARYELVAWFGTHLAYLILVLIGIVWMGYIVRYGLTTYKKERTAWEQKLIKDKYLAMR